MHIPIRIFAIPCICLIGFSVVLSAFWALTQCSQLSQPASSATIWLPITGIIGAITAAIAWLRQLTPKMKKILSAILALDLQDVTECELKEVLEARYHHLIANDYV
ncbi:hypothetical protein CPB84DRAFT_1854029 [Gymnopilus junonius]|uniref:Uncharacterized protein n=1 Tax=Gymnopilus junonius TaxID=109634 RepID=A0A9P5NAN6_GYMJU|nr:hypothetical protein CPB84DRAFT_1854029 [Gymnopilus junonius]